MLIFLHLVLFKLLMEELLQVPSELEELTRLIVEDHAVLEDLDDVVLVVLEGAVLVPIELLLDGREVHGVLD